MATGVPKVLSVLTRHCFETHSWTATMFAFIVIVLILYMITMVIKPKKFPPGPTWLPFVGCSLLFKKLTTKCGSQHVAAQKLADSYNTNVLGLKLGREPYTIVFNEKLIREVLCSEDYEGRPDNFFFRLRGLGMRKGITGVDGPLWQEQRQFAMRHLRNVGFGKPIMEEYIIEELHQLIKSCGESHDNISLNLLLAPHVLNVLWMFTAGKRIDKEDARLPQLLTLLKTRSGAFDMCGGFLNQFPELRFILPEWTGYNLLKKLNSQLYDFFMDAINDHKKTISVANEDLIHTFLCEMNERKDDKNSTFSIDQLIIVCLDLFIAGSQTTSNSLDFAFLMMLAHPEMQRKVQAELDEVLMNRTPCLEDKNILPYTMAVLHETQRFFNIVPLNGPRRVVRDTELDGYLLPKNTVVLVSLFSVHMDREIWTDPQVFRPERFIGSDGKINDKLVDRLMSFGLGRRRCLGEALARGCLFLFFTGVMQRFNITTSNGVIPSTEAIVGITSNPPPYTAKLVPRLGERQ
ncbi:cytochrome P450 305a1 [Arctopsyche grandis]|uniref:cytochrome P450 305a1 n=1 Tax=Arctopsyche grandis TaxID=121162 RepID=UPI00406D7077